LKIIIKELHIKRVTLILATNELKKIQCDAEETGPRNNKISWASEVNGKKVSTLWPRQRRQVCMAIPMGENRTVKGKQR